jgi:hypothetical protein
MNEVDENLRHQALRRLTDPETTGRSGVFRAIVIVLAVIGVLALIAVGGMFWMHHSMMGGTGMGMGMGRR